ncbi:MAG: signal recognition particle-docking protein FtsY [Verrucomicrobia bacterium]|nr:signal recognition particle-docking protein FtsY [Verrucomicrobiota bacterium]MBT6103108.1 signal recognition particle-docking protein FtsY [Verrucomicrobiota bacterium]MBT7912262.1 signal recognition particle-docking protein FtsY [Verrucomicrobiota bacterium]MDA7675324.1 signal recognition particle-docking protein FtsY [bacterium]
MGLFTKIFSGLKKTQSKLSTEIRRIVTRSPKLTGDDIEELEGALLASDMGLAVTERVVDAVRSTYESSGAQAGSVLEIAQAEVVSCLGESPARLAKRDGLTVVSLVGVNGAGKTTTAAKLAHRVKADGGKPMLAACDTFRAAAIEQLNLWGERLDIPVISSNYGADPASVAHDAASSALGKGSDYLFIDTAGRLHTKHNLMRELEKLHRVISGKVDGAPHETLLVIDASVGMNAMNQAREFNKTVPLTGLVITKLDGTSKGGMVVAIQHELGLPVKFIGLGEQPDDLQPFIPADYARALFFEE